MTAERVGRIRICVAAVAFLLAWASVGCEEEKKNAPTEKAAPPPKTEPTAATPLSDMGKAVGDAGKAIIEGGGRIIEGTGKVVVEGGGKVVDGAGKVIGGAGVAIGKAVGDVVVVTLGPDTTAFNFTLIDEYNNKKVSLSDYKGHPVLLLFCTTNYAPCVVELRHLRDMQEKYAEDGLKVLAIAMDWEGPASLRSFTEKMDLNYPLLWDNGKTFKEYTSLSRVPTTFFIDKSGNIWKKRVGFRSAMIVTGGGQFLGSTMVEMDKDFEKDVVDLLKK